jgi:hypothetical protein
MSPHIMCSCRAGTGKERRDPQPPGQHETVGTGGGHHEYTSVPKTYNGNIADQGYPVPTEFKWDPWNDPNIVVPCCYLVYVESMTAPSSTAVGLAATTTSDGRLSKSVL